MEVKIKKGGPEEEEELSEPVSPTGQYFSIPPAVCIIGVFEFENPVDDSNFAAVIMDTFPRINPRFTSVMGGSENYADQEAINGATGGDDGRSWRVRAGAG
ncbi:hypothetical protein L1987_58060 [Smallanthus sonchifolius]|uniref:Uncharacterized protein n=1 Tax=Smallanthus sonchifolius TaxID=185202 RepID=A0ACB9DEQ0_9ASTR|nr:hypothetical protein L1987_58060 [Smallanthus sonchifolius]